MVCFLCTVGIFRVVCFNRQLFSSDLHMRIQVLEQSGSGMEKHLVKASVCTEAASGPVVDAQEAAEESRYFHSLWQASTQGAPGPAQDSAPLSLCPGEARLSQTVWPPLPALHGLPRPSPALSGPPRMHHGSGTLPPRVLD